MVALLSFGTVSVVLHSFCDPLGYAQNRRIRAPQALIILEELYFEDYLTSTLALYIRVEHFMSPGFRPFDHADEREVLRYLASSELHDLSAVVPDPSFPPFVSCVFAANKLWVPPQSLPGNVVPLHFNCLNESRRLHIRPRDVLLYLQVSSDRLGGSLSFGGLLGGLLGSFARLGGRLSHSKNIFVNSNSFNGLYLKSGLYSKFWI